jgi:hypothetical protein
MTDEALELSLDYSFPYSPEIRIAHFSSCIPVVVAKQATKSLTTFDLSFARYRKLRFYDSVLQFLVIFLPIIVWQNCSTLGRSGNRVSPATIFDTDWRGAFANNGKYPSLPSVLWQLPAPSESDEKQGRAKDRPRDGLQVSECPKIRLQRKPLETRMLEATRIHLF